MMKSRRFSYQNRLLFRCLVCSILFSLSFMGRISCRPLEKRTSHFLSSNIVSLSKDILLFNSEKVAGDFCTLTAFVLENNPSLMLYNIEAYQLFSLYRLISFAHHDTYNRHCPGYKPAIIKDMWILDIDTSYRIYHIFMLAGTVSKYTERLLKCIRFRSIQHDIMRSSFAASRCRATTTDDTCRKISE